MSGNGTLSRVRRGSRAVALILTACGGCGAATGACAAQCTPAKVAHPIRGLLAIATKACPGGTQGKAYAGCTVVAQGGSPPYVYSVADSPDEGIGEVPAFGRRMRRSASTPLGATKPQTRL